MLVDDTLRVQFVTNNLSTGSAENPTVTPTVILRRNGITVVGSGAVVTPLGSGLYESTVTLIAAQGWTPGDTFSLVASWLATPDDIAQTLPLAQGVIGNPVDVSGLATAASVGAIATEVDKAVDRSGFCLTVLAGSIANANTEAEQFNLTMNGVGHQVLFVGLDEQGNRTGVALSKS